MSPVSRRYVSGGTTYQVVERTPWSPAQLVAVVAGLVLVVIGGVALARSGAHFNAIPLTHTSVAGLHFTALSALVQLIAGVILLAGGAIPSSAKVTMMIIGVAMLAWGLIVAIDPAPFFNMWGYTASNGVFYTVIGVILMVAAAISPVFFSRKVSSQDAGSYQQGAGPYQQGAGPYQQGAGPYQQDPGAFRPPTAPRRRI